MHGFPRLAGLGGLVFLVLIIGLDVASFAITARPFPGAPVDEITGYLADHATLVAVGSVLAPVIWITLTLFVVGLAVVLWASSNHLDAWVVVGVIGVVLQTAIYAVVLALQVGLMSQARAGVPAEELARLWATYNAAFTVNGVSLTLLIGGSRLRPCERTRRHGGWTPAASWRRC